MTTDIHTHLGEDRTRIQDVNFDNLSDNVDILLHSMDTFGIDSAVLTPIEPRISTDLYLAAAEIQPERLYCACSVFPRPIDTAKKKLREYINRGCIALVLDSDMYHPSDPAAHALVQLAVDEELPVYFHCEEMTANIADFIDRSSLIHDDGKFVVLHMGGLFGFDTLLPLISRKNIWLEISVTLVKLVESPLRVFLDALIQDVGVSRLVFGSEHHTEYLNLQAAMNMIDLNVETSSLITRENAWVILGIPFY